MEIPITEANAVHVIEELSYHGGLLVVIE